MRYVKKFYELESRRYVTLTADDLLYTAEICEAFNLSTTRDLEVLRFMDGHSMSEASRAFSLSTTRVSQIISNSVRRARAKVKWFNLSMDDSVRALAILYKAEYVTKTPRYEI